MEVFRIIPISPDPDMAEMNEEFKDGFFFQDKETAEMIMATIDQLTPEEKKIQWKCDIIPIMDRDQAITDLVEVFGGRSSKPN